MATDMQCRLCWRADRALVSGFMAACGSSFKGYPLSSVFTRLESLRILLWQHAESRQADGYAEVALAAAPLTEHVVAIVHIAHLVEADS